MTDKQAKYIGSKLALKSVGIGIAIAEIIMTLLTGGKLLWFTKINYLPNIIVGVIIMVLGGYYFGQKAGFDILIKKKDAGWIGFKYGMIILFLTVFLASWVGFFREGINLLGTDDNPFFDYIYKPVFWVLIFGLFPVLIVGFWFGKQIKNKS